MHRSLLLNYSFQRLELVAIFNHFDRALIRGWLHFEQGLLNFSKSVDINFEVFLIAIFLAYIHVEAP